MGVDNGVRHGPRREDGVVPLQELARDLRGGRDHRGDGPEAEGHERAVDLGEAREGAVRLVTEEVEAADEGQRARPGWEAAACVCSEVEEGDGEERGDWREGMPAAIGAAQPFYSIYLQTCERTRAGMRDSSGPLFHQQSGVFVDSSFMYCGSYSYICHYLNFFVQFLIGPHILSGLQFLLYLFSRASFHYSVKRETI